MTPEEFRNEFESRTLAYEPGFRDLGRPVVVEIGRGAHCRAGHTLLVVLANLLARVHRSVVFVGELDRPLLCPAVLGGNTLETATVGLMRRVNPFGAFERQSDRPEDPLVILGVGVDHEVDLALGCDAWLAILGPAAPVVDVPGAAFGAVLAACLGANVAFHRVLGDGATPAGTFSAWDHMSRSSHQGPVLTAPLDIGRVLQVGAGAVGAALDLFLAMLMGTTSPWALSDGDSVDVTNLNRQLLFTAADAGFQEGPSRNKAHRAAEILGPTAKASDQWYDAADPVLAGPFDVILALANEHGVRSFLQARQPTVLLHATTTTSWQAQLHRHIAGRDDCIVCRLPEDLPRFKCSTEEVETPEGRRFDAAVPVLSAMAGLLLLVALVRLEHGALADERGNRIAIELSAATPSEIFRTIRSCRDGCTVRKSARVRGRLESGNRWHSLDPALVSDS
jgi:molybdopterin/thiamine biosynthesis adenylyltransferase